MATKIGSRHDRATTAQRLVKTFDGRVSKTLQQARKNKDGKPTPEQEAEIAENRRQAEKWRKEAERWSFGFFVFGDRYVRLK